jgi:hypothetical protein
MSDVSLLEQLLTLRGEVRCNSCKTIHTVKVVVPKTKRAKKNPCACRKCGHDMSRSKFRFVNPEVSK